MALRAYVYAATYKQAPCVHRQDVNLTQICEPNNVNLTGCVNLSDVTKLCYIIHLSTPSLATAPADIRQRISEPRPSIGSAYFGAAPIDGTIPDGSSREHRGRIQIPGASLTTLRLLI